MLKIPLLDMSLKITDSKLQLHLLWATELSQRLFFYSLYPSNRSSAPTVEMSTATDRISSQVPEIQKEADAVNKQQLKKGQDSARIRESTVKGPKECTHSETTGSPGKIDSSRPESFPKSVDKAQEMGKTSGWNRGSSQCETGMSAQASQMSSNRSRKERESGSDCEKADRFKSKQSVHSSHKTQLAHDVSKSSHSVLSCSKDITQRQKAITDAGHTNNSSLRESKRLSQPTSHANSSNPSHKQQSSRSSSHSCSPSHSSSDRGIQRDSQSTSPRRHKKDAHSPSHCRDRHNRGDSHSSSSSVASDRKHQIDSSSACTHEKKHRKNSHSNSHSSKHKDSHSSSHSLDCKKRSDSRRWSRSRSRSHEDSRTKSHSSERKHSHSSSQSSHHKQISGSRRRERSRSRSQEDSRPHTHLSQHKHSCSGSHSLARKQTTDSRKRSRSRSHSQEDSRTNSRSAVHKHPSSSSRSLAHKHNSDSRRLSRSRSRSNEDSRSDSHSSKNVSPKSSVLRRRSRSRSRSREKQKLEKFSADSDKYQSDHSHGIKLSPNTKRMLDLREILSRKKGSRERSHYLHHRKESHSSKNKPEGSSDSRTDTHMPSVHSSAKSGVKERTKGPKSVSDKVATNKKGEEHRKRKQPISVSSEDNKGEIKLHIKYICSLVQYSCISKALASYISLAHLW